MFKLPKPTFNPDKWQAPFIIILIAEIITLIGFQTSVSIIPFFLQDDLGIVEDKSLKMWVGVLAALPSVAMAVFAPIWGGLADRLGKRLMLLRAMFGGAVIILLMTFVTHPVQLLILRTLQGCLTGSVAAATVLVAALAPRASTGFALGLLQVGVYLGGALGPALGGFLFAAFGGRGNFLITSLLLLLASVVTLIFVPEPADKNLASDSADKPIIKKKLINFAPLKESPFLLFLILIIFVSQAAFNMAVSVLGVFVQLISPQFDIRQAAASSSIILALSAGSAALGAVFFGTIGKKFSFHHLLIICFAGAALSVIPQGFSNSWVALLIFRVVNNFFVGGVMPSINTMLVYNTDKNQQGAVFGLSSAFSSAGVALGPALGGFIAGLMHGVTGYRLTFFISAALLAALTVTLIVHRRREKEVGVR